MTKFHNVRVEMNNRDVAILRWEDDVLNRMSLALNPHTLEMQEDMASGPQKRCALVKAPPKNAKSWERFSPRFLDASAKANAALIKAVRASVDLRALVDEHLAEFDEKDRQHKADADQERVENARKAAGPALYDAVLDALLLLRAEHNLGRIRADGVIMKLERALAQADRP